MHKKIYSNSAGKLCNATTHPAESVSSSLQLTESVNVGEETFSVPPYRNVFLINAESP